MTTVIVNLRPGMYRMIVRRILQKAYRQLSQGDYEAVLKSFAPDAVFCFVEDRLYEDTQAVVQALDVITAEVQAALASGSRPATGTAAGSRPQPLGPPPAGFSLDKSTLDVGLAQGKPP